MKEIKMKAEVANIEVMTDELNAWFEENDVPMKVVLQMDVALDEILSNIAFYAYEGEKGDMTVKAEMLNDNKTIRIEFSDTGIEFDPLKKKDPDITLSAEERKIGGLGIFMVKKTMDHVSYERRGDTNIFVMEKNL
ncbi:MAG: ATP-binding protein [Lachnospiraceae bacterium]|nr:ATP-binding protein [Lachnospiraceae bacterium]